MGWPIVHTPSPSWVFHGIRMGFAPKKPIRAQSRLAHGSLLEQVQNPCEAHTEKRKRAIWLSVTQLSLELHFGVTLHRRAVSEQKKTVLALHVKREPFWLRKKQLSSQK